MAKSTSFQKNLIHRPMEILESMIPDFKSIDKKNNYRISILEKCASQIGGFSYRSYLDSIKWNNEVYEIEENCTGLIEAMKKVNIPSSVLLSMLVSIETSNHEKKKTGSYYTDFRLANNLVERLDINFEDNPEPKIIDLSAGTGILLATLSHKLAKKAPIELILSKCVYGSDLSENALRGSLLSMASMTSNIEVVKNLRDNLFLMDSLSTPLNKWMELMPSKFDIILGNPPWEKLKITKHEYLNSLGHNVHYGSNIVNTKSEELNELKTQLKEYIKTLKHLLPTKRTEVDLYIPFLKLALELTREGGYVAQIIPASLIRNKGVAELREEVFANSTDLSITIYDNKPKYFEIDSRFKFLALTCRVGNSTPDFNLNYSISSNDTIEFTKYSKINKKDLLEIRNDYSVPEVKNQHEWYLFRKIAQKFKPFGEPSSIWEHTYHREIDMSLDKGKFKAKKTTGSVPVIEGRMIHQFKSGIKGYVSGTGRKAVWKETICSDIDDFVPQYHINTSDIPSKQLGRYSSQRVGFCDVTGQTNERTMLATIIPAYSICGNKVPTLEFKNDYNLELSYLWVAVANSFVFDWLIRRTITTNANFFIVDGVPIPQPDMKNPLVIKLLEKTKKLMAKKDLGYNWEYGERRAEIDAIVAHLYKISFNEFKLILEDFPIIDKLQPTISEESHCTLTKDLVLRAFLNFAEYKSKQNELSERLRKYYLKGAIPYVPSQFIGLINKKNNRPKWIQEPLLANQ